MLDRPTLPDPPAAQLLGLAEAQAPAPLAMHDALRDGLPAAALQRAVERVRLLRDQAIFEDVMAMSLRTYQRLRDQPEKRLDLAASGRLWRFAEIFALATDVLGSADEAERWLASPAIGLDQRRPIDLLGTPVGAGLVEELLGRMDHGVFA